MSIQHLLKGNNSTPRTTYLLHQAGASVTHYEGTLNKQVRIAVLAWRCPNYEQILDAFMQLSSNFAPSTVLLLGEVLDAEIALTELVDTLLGRNIFPIILSKEPFALDISLAAFNRYKPKVSVGYIDSNIPYSFESPNSALNRLMQNKESIQQLTLLAYQSYLIDEAVVQMLADYYFGLYRVGQMQNNLELTEPLVRDFDLCGINIRCIRFSDAPGREDTNPNGLFASEICQLIRYMGLGDTLKCLTIQGIELKHDIRTQTSSLIAQMIWFAIGSIEGRMHEYPLDTEQLNTYLVDLPALNSIITFHKSSKSDRWWFVPPKNLVKNTSFIACAYLDYQMACQGELSDYILNEINRLSS